MYALKRVLIFATLHIFNSHTFSTWFVVLFKEGAFFSFFSFGVDISIRLSYLTMFFLAYTFSPCLE